MSNQRKKAVRLTFAYEDSSIELISQQPVDMIPPPSDPVETPIAESGFWLELKDGQGGTLYRQVMHSPIGIDREVFSEDENQSVSRMPVERPQGVFTIVIPDVEEAQAVSLHSSPLQTENFFQAASELKRFELTYK
jgi:hypothetical protein